MDLHIKYDNFKISKESHRSYDLMQTMRGIKYSFKQRKLFSFMIDNEINNEIIDYYMGIKPQRQEGEEYNIYKMRLKFQKLLLKFRPYLFDYSVYETDA